MQARTRQQSATIPRQRPQLSLREVPGKGRGVFAMRAFAKGEEVLEFLGDIRDVGEFADLTYALQVGPRAFLSASGGIDDYVNHSCLPNCGIHEVRGRILLFALKPILKNEEISFDYSTTQTGGFWEMDCQCGSPNCRRRIGDFRDLPRTVRDRYIADKALLPYLISEAD